MEKKSIWSRIKNFFIHLFALILSLFKKKEKKDEKEIQVFEENINRNRIKLKELDTTTLPDTQSTKASNEEESTQDNKEKEVILYKRDQKSEIMDINKLIALTYDEDRIKEIIDEILKEEYEIDIKRTKKVIEENVEKLKEKILEDIKEKYEKEEFKKEEQLKEYLKEEMKKEIEKHPLEIPRYPSKYVIATTVRDNINPPKAITPQINTNNKIKTTPKKKKEQIKEKAANTKIAMIKTDEPAIIKPKDRLFVAASTATVLATGVATELIKPLKKQEDVTVPLKEEKEVELPKLKAEEIEISHVTPDPILLSKEETPTTKKEEKVIEEKETELTIEQDIQEEKEQLQDHVQTKLNEFQYVDDHNDEIKSNELAKINKERLEKENEKIIAEIKIIEEQIQELKEQKEEIEKPKEEQKEEPTQIVEVPTEEIKPEEKKEVKKEEVKKEEKKETPPPAPDFALTPNIDSAVKDTNIEMQSDKEIEDKRYDEYEQQLDELLYDIEMYRIKYDKSLNKEQKKKLKDEERKIRSAKTNIQYQKSLDIEKERKHLEQEILPTELKGLELELRKKHLENKRDLNEELIEKVEDLEFMTDEKVHKLEKKLIKKKLRKALIVSQMSSILALPFIRNKYFFYFTAGLIAKTELVFLKDLFKRKTSEFEPVELTAIKNGKDALYGALNVTRENIMYLESLETTAIIKYPELSFDSEYLQYINSLKNSLARTENKLSRKINTLDKYLRKTTRKVHKLEKKLTIDEEENEK